jgi:hypothetical protein
MSETTDPLDQLTSKELHDLAIKRAKRHLDVKFLYQLMQVLPAAEAAAGDLDEADADIQHTLAHLDDITDSGQGETAEMLRPFYLDYLRKHNVKP